MGFYSVCSAHNWVLQAAMEQAVEDSSYLCIESTSNQVNQFGGYTGLTPAHFAEHVQELLEQCGLPRECLLLGGDHLGPYPWRHLPANEAMQNACVLVRECVMAGYEKIHLDASMACADDPPHLTEEEVTRRAALLCEAAERACDQSGRASGSVMYVIGTEVPTPEGEKAHEAGLQITNASAVTANLELSHRSFAQLGLERAWERVIALVVQPGVEFGESSVTEYDRAKAHSLVEALLVRQRSSTKRIRPTIKRPRRFTSLCRITLGF